MIFANKVTETRELSGSTLRDVCIARHWCNNCDSEQYEELLQFADKKPVTTEDIASIALTIDEYTADNDYCGHPEEIAFVIAKACFSLFTIEKTMTDMKKEDRS